MAELTLAPPVNKDPDYETWAAYWQEMRRHSLTLVSEAFDAVADGFAAGDTRATVDVVIFCADESNGVKGIVTALTALLIKRLTDYEAAAEIEAGTNLEAVAKMVSL